MTMLTMIGNEEMMIISIRILFILLCLILHSNCLPKWACQTATIFVYLPHYTTCQAVYLKGYLSYSSVIPWLFHRGMTTILIIVSCSETTVTMITIISDEEMMTIVTIA